MKLREGLVGTTRKKICAKLRASRKKAVYEMFQLKLLKKKEWKND